LLDESRTNGYGGFIFKEDEPRYDQHAAQTAFLAEHPMDTMTELKDYQSDIQGKLDRYISARQELRNKLRHKSEAPNQSLIKKQISDLTYGIQRYRKEIKTCDDIAIESVEKAEKLRRYTQSQLRKEKTHDKFSGRSRADGKDIARRR
jgi:hypothetical protein